jgi:mannose-binding lectin 2
MGASRKPGTGNGGSWFGTFFKLFLFAGLCAGGYFGYLEYLKRNRFSGGGNFGRRSGGGGFGGGGFGGSPSPYSPGPVYGGGGMYDNKRY